MAPAHSIVKEEHQFEGVLAAVKGRADGTYTDDTIRFGNKTMVLTQMTAYKASEESAFKLSRTKHSQEVFVMSLKTARIVAPVNFILLLAQQLSIRTAYTAMVALARACIVSKLELTYKQLFPEPNGVKFDFKRFYTAALEVKAAFAGPSRQVEKNLQRIMHGKSFVSPCRTVHVCLIVHVLF